MRMEKLRCLRCGHLSRISNHPGSIDLAFLGLSKPVLIKTHSPSDAQIASTLAFVAVSISIIAGHGRSNPSAFHLRVASMPIFEP